MDERQPSSDETATASTWSDGVALAMPRPLDSADGRRQRDEVRARLFDVPQNPEYIGRYEIIRRVGQGALGVVYLARDAKLGREVAIKLLRRTEVTAATARLQREARVMAQLSHPNVANVFEVGLHEHAVFIAMEFVDGETLRQWQRGRTADEIVAAYLQAGRGLAAAHHARIVHRDFKPDNVMIGRDGRVRVLDFGVARASDTAVAAPTGPTQVSSVSLTLAGSTLGTPAYMPPEQIYSGDVDARADQFAFAVSLFEALSGTRPFGGRSIPELIASMTAGVDAKAAAAIAPRLRRVLRRALQIDVAHRYDDMDALCTAIEGARRRSRLPPLLAVAGAAVVGLAVAAMGGGDRCATMVTDVDDGWSRANAASIRARARSDARWQSAVDAVDGGVAAWRAEATALCERDAVEPDDALRRACLDDVRQSLIATIDALHMADDHDASLDAVPRVLDREACLDTRRRGAVPLTPTAGEADAIGRVRAGISAAVEAGRAGEYAIAAERIAPAVDEARTIDEPALLAEALLLASAAANQLDRYQDAERDAVEAYELARAAGHDRLALRAAADLVAQVGHGQGRRADGEAWARAGDALVGRFEVGDVMRTRFLLNRGLMRLDFGENERAREDLEAARAGYIAKFGPDSPEQMPVLSNLAHIAFDARDLERAQSLLDTQLALVEKGFGSEHRELVDILVNRTLVSIDREHWDAARADLERATRLCEGHEHALDCMRIEGQRAQLAHELGDFAAARVHAQAYLEGLSKVLGPSHPNVVRAQLHLAEVMIAAGDVADARALLHHAIARAEGELADGSVPMLEAWLALASAEHHSGDLDASWRALERSANGGNDDRCLGVQWYARRARVLVERGETDAAMAALHSGRARASGCAPLEVAELDLAEAVAHVATDGVEPTAERLATAATACWRRRGGDWLRLVDAVETWLAAARHPGGRRRIVAPLP